MTEELKQALIDMQESFKDWEREFVQKRDDFWNKLTQEEKLLAFCYVANGLYKGELEDDKTYRGVLYNTFNFGPEAYVPAQFSGFLALHNSIRNERDREYFLKDLRKILVDSGLTKEKEEEICQKVMQLHL